MKRFASLFAFVLVLVGVELSTRGMSLIGSRLMAGLSAAVSGLSLPVSRVRFASGVVLLAVGLVGWVGAWWAAHVEEKASQVGQRCPSCGGRTQRIKRNRYGKLMSALVGEDLARRHCAECGWTGLAIKF